MYSPRSVSSSPLLSLHTAMEERARLRAESRREAEEMKRTREEERLGRGGGDEENKGGSETGEWWRN